MTDIRCTQRSADLVEVTFTGEYSVRCTPNHEFFLLDGTRKEAKALTSKDLVSSVSGSRKVLGVNSLNYKEDVY